MDVMKISMVQFDIAWEDKNANFKKITELIKRANVQSDIILLPEMFSTGFTMSPENVAEKGEGSTVNWMRELAAKEESAIAGSIVATESGKYYNRFYFVLPSGDLYYYDKKHLFSYGKENQHYHGGDKRLIVEYKGWNIMPFVCYDLRFPVWMRNPGHVDLYLCVANWPDSRIDAWDILLRARAVENQVYMAGVNRVGSQEGKLDYNGHSAIIKYDGSVISMSELRETVIHRQLSKSDLDNYRASFRFLEDKDEFEFTA